MTEGGLSKVPTAIVILRGHTAISLLKAIQNNSFGNLFDENQMIHEKVSGCDLKLVLERSMRKLM